MYSNGKIQVTFLSDRKAPFNSLAELNPRDCKKLIGKVVTKGIDQIIDRKILPQISRN